eukprot:gnl/Spiro4/29791_TR14637_c0_g1_i1.p1 gnl/Spiro4/29791_TR14637_c0_g1~~gnl/Spiro4/29791_TR14637_c0_g1_i1.p1  ORF type:complete len:500 (+),score=185.58 gnl/Spiro4/29791_TR14637_c0_g1_i1:65-1564(+)
MSTRRDYFSAVTAQQRTADNLVVRERAINDRNRDYIKATMDDRANNRRWINSQRQHQQEQQIHEQLMEDRARQEREAHVKAQDDRFLRQLEARKIEQLRNAKMTQQLHETSPELQWLARKLQTAAITKERETQLAERKAIAQLEDERSHKLMRDIEAQRQKRNEELDERERVRRANAHHGKEVLDQQLEEREERRRELYERFLKDKAEVDRIVQQVREQEDNEARERMQKANESREEIQHYMEMRAQWRAEEKARQDEETRKIMEYMEEKQREHDAEQARKKTAERERDRLHDQISAEIAEQRRRQEEMENLQLTYYREIEEAKRREEERQSILKKAEMRRNLQAAFEKDRERRHELAETKRVEEEQFRIQMMEKFAEDERIDMLNARARQQRQLNHRKQVEQMIVERRRQQEQAREADRDIMRNILRAEKERDDLVEAERKRLIREHAMNLLGYLPKGVLHDQDVQELPETHQVRQDFTRARALRARQGITRDPFGRS